MVVFGHHLSARALLPRQERARSLVTSRSLVSGLATLMLGMAMQSCQKEPLQLTSAKPGSVVTSAAEVNSAQKDFAKVLAKAIVAEPEVRAFLKEEATKQFDNDYDVLYQMVKDKPVGGGATLHDRLARYTGAAELATIEANSPLLSIFIPTLPGGFSPLTWNAQTEVPVVAVSLRGDNKVPFYDAAGKETVIEPGQTPGFPTLLIKENERVQAASTASIGKEKADLKFYDTNELAFYFLDKSFDGVHPAPIIKQPNPTPNPLPSALPPEVLAKLRSTANGIASRTIGYNQGDNLPNYRVYDAKTMNGMDPNGPYSQRDWVYYYISQYSNTGTLDNNFREYIKSMTFSVTALDKMSDQSEDPIPYSSSGSPDPTSWWTEGNYEIQISVLINAKNGVGPTYPRIISVSPSSLYNVTYRGVAPGYYVRQSVTPKVFYANVDLVPWDLQNYGSAWKFVFLEHDNAETDTYNTSNTSTFGTNFEVNVSGGGKDTKVGGKFGISTTSQNTTSYGISITKGDDMLGEAILTYDRPIINSEDPVNLTGYTTYEITTGGQYGYLSVSVEPGPY